MPHRIDQLLAAFRVFKPDDGWRCVKISNTRITLRHPDLGERIVRIRSNGRVEPQDP